jgi:hypothetical protein
MIETPPCARRMGRRGRHFLTASFTTSDKCPGFSASLPPKSPKHPTAVSAAALQYSSCACRTDVVRVARTCGVCGAGVHESKRRNSRYIYAKCAVAPVRLVTPMVSTIRSAHSRRAASRPWCRQDRMRFFRDVEPCPTGPRRNQEGVCAGGTRSVELLTAPSLNRYCRNSNF